MLDCEWEKTLNNAPFDKLFGKDDPNFVVANDVSSVFAGHGIDKHHNRTQTLL